MNEQDYRVFLSYLREYLTPPDDESKIFPSRELKNYAGGIHLLCYCLMANHFHLLIKQSLMTMMTCFMRSLSTRYSIYFNTKYARVGGLFQSNYKAVRVKGEGHLCYLTRYIHRNPLTSRSNLEVMLSYRYSSLRNYLGQIRQDWLEPNEVLSYFSKEATNLGYLSFISDDDYERDDCSALLVDDIF